MSIAPDPAELSAPRDPAAYRAGRGGWLWPALGFGLSGVVLGVFLALFVGGLNKAAPPPAPSASSSTPWAEPPELAPPPVVVDPAAAGVSGGDLEGRIAALEQDRRRTAEAASAALLAAALIEASQGSAPFADELAALAAAAPQTAELRGLRGLAEAGAPSRGALAASFPEAAARAAAAARDPGDGATLGARVGHILSRVISIRRVGEVSGDGVDARLARAERQLADGEVAGALRTLDKLPAPAREALSGWRARAERRAEIDRRVESLRRRALQDLAALSRGQP